MLQQVSRFYRTLKDPAAVFVRDFVQSSAKQLKQGATVLDAGAGQCTYKPLFAHCKYTAVDNAVGDSNWDYSHLDVVAPLNALPFKENTFDAVLCTEVLEHLDDPLACLKELARVLKSDGNLFITVPFHHIEHQIPYDFYRYTSYGLRMLLTKAGFKASSISVERTSGGIFLRWAYELTALYAIFPSLRIGRGRKNFGEWMLVPFKSIFLIGLRIMQIFLLIIDPLDKTQIATFGWNVTVKGKFL